MLLVGGARLRHRGTAEAAIPKCDALRSGPAFIRANPRNSKCDLAAWAHGCVEWVDVSGRPSNYT